MEKFSLDKWLKDKSRKVVTRDGRKVRILCIDCGVRKSQPILVEITCSRNTKVLGYYNTDGTTQDKNLNLFFADEEEEELTDFESDLFTAFSDAWQKYLRGESVNVAEWAKEHSKELLESARKEILKDLPKWKKATENKEFDKHVLLFEDEKRVVLTTELYKGEYYIELSDLETLSKEE